MDLNQFNATVGNWRDALKQNERKTKLVILTFLLIYIGVGLIADIYLLTSLHPQASLETVFYALFTFKVVPYATIIMAIIAIISLIITYSMYDRIMLMGTTYKEISPTDASSLQERQLYNVVEEMKVAAGLQYMPRVFIIEANYMNAFASGYSERSAMVAITRGLIEKLDRAELQAVMAHELSHIRHHDIKLTLMVAVLSNIMLMLVDILFYSVLFRRDRKGDNGIATVIILLRYLLPLLTLVLGLFLTRTREYMADSGSVELMRDNEPLARALLKITNDHESNAQEYQTEYGRTAHEQIRHAAYLYDPSSLDPLKSFANVFSTHPGINERLAAIGFVRKKNTPPNP